ncbi:UDP-N-acetylenolpyruvoylglucosamine reductase [Canicola haemoglobinophilus]|uniref:UDP-N-acetylenolpyruvoylglucosamine reductase n=1 Tax=Canicola haemoglobinophilus TaxID=733 RepID=A0A1V4B2P3_9PAST|nr:UDP-N-acetylmuramate dehydrogenase [Canicola haemoglobinophilus]OOS01539.1 UDP-N-acetylenolpyruvoylglucosamine reductase [Canicola haemoglobinophilus]STO59999.1 UDP-N-acetylenolpyruvoylglucosamine reductase [Canicola haemoglobinophilus]
MENLQAFHTFHILAQAKKVIKITALSQLIEQWKLANEAGLPILFLGQGSNVLFVEDFNGVIFVNQLMGIEHQQDEDFHYLHVNGGENWHDLVQWSLAQGIYGLENLALIPGCAGSAPIQNIGAYGVEFKDVCDYVDVLDLQKNEIFRLSNEECAFAYRESVFKGQYKDGYVIIAIGLKLAKNWQPVLKYGTLTKFGENVSAQEIFTEVCHIRQSKLPNPEEFGNAGSFFKNPVISAQEFAHLQQAYPDIPSFPQADGSVKLAAGWLIDQAGLKGYQIGGAAVHQQQALVIINKDNATSSDVVELARYIRQTVALKFNVYLQPEVRFIAANGEVDSTAYIA